MKLTILTFTDQFPNISPSWLDLDLYKYSISTRFEATSLGFTKKQKKEKKNGSISIEASSQHRLFDRPFLGACVSAVKGVSHCSALIPKIGTCM